MKCVCGHWWNDGGWYWEIKCHLLVVFSNIWAVLDCTHVDIFQQLPTFIGLHIDESSVHRSIQKIQLNIYRGIRSLWNIDANNCASRLQPLTAEFSKWGFITQVSNLEIRTLSYNICNETEVTKSTESCGKRSWRRTITLIFHKCYWISY